MKEVKERIDKLVVDRGLFETRGKARSYILAGNIYVEGVRITKASKTVPVNSKIEVKLPNEGYVSRGGIKLKRAIDQFGLNVSGKHCLDIGSSTGGFTDCLLKKGANVVTAVDVGKGLLHKSLLDDKRVNIYEGYNARYIDRINIGYIPEIVTIDVSFISIRLILRPLKKLVNEESLIISLIKPQFELEKGFRGFKGVIRDKKLHRDIIFKLHGYFTETSYSTLGYTYSPLKGPKGNIEYFVLLKKENDRERCIENNRVYDIDYFNNLINSSHQDLDKN